MHLIKLPPVIKINTIFPDTLQHCTVVNPVITIDQQTLVDQATSLGTPVTMALNSPAFSEVAPLALVLPGDGPSIVPGNGAAAMFITFTSLSLLLLVSIFVI